MLNLLFISDSPKAEYIKNELQPFLKVIIDVVTDFDRGMKDVFEKRPATVCIQDHIGGVTGESVARHIQMLLGSGAPTFILFHTGNAKARVINGLFENLVDLSLSHDSVVENLLGTLKQLLGNNWEKVYIPPKLTDASVGSTVSIIIPDASLTTEKKAEKRIPSVIAGSPEQIAAPYRKTPSEKTADSSPGKIDMKSDSTAIASSPTLPAEEFRISKDIPPIDDHIPEDLLLAFEENYRSKSLFMRRSYIVVLAFVVCAAGGWFFLTQKPQTVTSLKLRLLPSSATKQAPVVVTTTTIPAQKPAPPPLPLPVVAPALPSFIPKDGIDRTFSQKKPGWNRYVGKQYEFRVFTAGGRIQAIQVVSIGASIPEPFITSALQEFAGSAEYQILSRSTKDGVRVETGKIQKKGEIIFYRKNGSVKAFVVSVN